ncbi:MAG: adenylate/guanylate cyclase domain-containing protein [Actinomycetota bacterium]|nr:adenylate/guanylate cyclase domain-containing protein [Actinomycetota bacterium]
MADTLEEARKALERHAWADALTLLRQADAAKTLDAVGLEMLADAAWWLAQPDDSLAARERAHAAFVKAGNKRRAAMAALRLAQDNGNKLAYAAAGAWLERATKLLEGDEDCAEFGYLLFVQVAVAHAAMGLDATVAQARRANELGKRFGDRDLEAFSAMGEGLTLIAYGDVAAGLARLDAATVAAVAGDLSPFTTGWVYCGTIGACRDLADYRRASEWTEATTRWCERQSVTGFPGICRVHRAEVIELHGSWAQAEQEARKACDELQRFQITGTAGLGFYAIGHIRLRIGDLPAAEDAFRRAHELGVVPEPGLSLVRLAQGDAAAAASSLRRALANEPERSARARMLPAEVEVALAVGDRERARLASKELDGLAVAFGTVAMDAAASTARAALQLADGDAVSAEKTIGAALRQWQALEIPYDAARARLVLAAALRAQGDEAAAKLELQAARSTFERLGARLDIRRASELLGDEAHVTSTEPTQDRVTRTFLFTDIVRSTKLVDAIGDVAWQDVIRWHDQTLRSLIAEHQGQEIRHQGDGFFVSFDSAGDAVECAVAIQRRLAEQRRAQGFAPQVRIGMHTADAHRRGLDYTGFGIHEAARIGGVAAADEILVSAATLESAAKAYPSEKRTVTLKDISEPVEVASIDWR